jgi:hypothetical protein
MLRHLNIILISALAFSIFSCKNAEKQDDNIGADVEILDSAKVAVAVEKTKKTAEHVFNSLPDRGEILKLVAENRLEYDTGILNEPNNVKNYNTELYIALNLGVYGSDLSVAGVFDQTQESILFLKCVNSLSQKLGVNKAFDQSMFDRMEAQRDNKDSTLSIISCAFRQADEILKQNNRPATSALIIAGVWIEGFYTSCQIAKKTPSEGIVKAIIRHKETLDNIIVLLGQSNLSKESMFVLNDLTTISGIMTDILADKDNMKYQYETIAPADEAVTRLRSKVTSSF